MKKRLMCGLVLSVSLVSISAYAADGDDALTTKKYVNDGLSFVYGVANGTENGAVKNIQTALSDGNDGLINVGNLANAVGARGTGGAAGTGLAGAVQGLEETIGDGTTTGLAKDVADVKNALSDGNGGLVDVGVLQQTVSTLQENTTTYDAGAGIKVTPGATENDPSIISVKLPDDAQNGANYVFQANDNGGTWTKMEVASEWNSGFLTGGN